MKVIFVIDSINELNNKINILKNRFGNDILYVVKSNLIGLVKTYDIEVNATYRRSFAKIMQILLANNLDNDIVVCYSSVKLDNKLLNNFIAKIGNKEKIVNVMPTYNAFEKVCNSTYNVYVNGLFKVKDSMVSPKLQFLPADFVYELVMSHFSNRLFVFDEQYSSTLYIEKGELNSSLKTKTGFSKWQLIPVIVSLLISIGLVLALAFIKMNYLLILVFVFLYILDIVIALIFQCKSKFDKRFME